MARSRNCIFCDRRADSREHVWPLWIIERVGRRPITHKIGEEKKLFLAGPELKVRTVCSACNNGWMSALETKNKPVIGSLLQDLSTPLDQDQQRDLALWAMKTAMVVDSMATHRDYCYQSKQRKALRDAAEIPKHTTIWLARFEGSGLFAGGTDVSIKEKEALRVSDGIITNLLVGHLAIQSLTFHTLPGFPDEQPLSLPSRIQGAEQQLLIQIWPSNGSVMWPPNDYFKRDGLGMLVQRFKPASS